MSVHDDGAIFLYNWFKTSPLRATVGSSAIVQAAPPQYAPGTSFDRHARLADADAVVRQHWGWVKIWRGNRGVADFEEQQDERGEGWGAAQKRTRAEWVELW